jgi:hypothetical protein
VADFTAISAVTGTLQRILDQRMESAGTVNITTAPPDVDVPTIDNPIVNLFLHRVTESPTLKNQDLPGLASPGSYGHPPLSLDLHYLITATGQDPNDDRGAQQILGDVMLTLHQHPFIAKDDPLLDPALTNEVELLKVTIEPLDPEQLASLWTATTSPMRLAIGYQVTVVQLEPTVVRTVAKPVLEPPEAGLRLHAVPLDRPAIDSIGVLRRLADGSVDERDVAYARTGEQLVVRGRGFVGGARVLLDDLDTTDRIDPSSTASRMLVTVDHPELGAGVHRVQVVRDVELGDPPDQRSVPFLRSNVSAFVHLPTVTAATPAAGPAGTDLAITGDSLFRDDAPSMVLIGDRAFPIGDGSPTEVTVTVDGLAPAVYPISVRVNGAESIDPFEFEVTA